MRQAKNHEEAVSFRLRSVVAGVRPVADACPPAVPAGGGLFADQTPLSWSDVVTTWPDDADLGPEPVRDPAGERARPESPGPPSGDGPLARPIDPSAWRADPLPGSVDPSAWRDDPLPGPIDPSAWGDDRLAGPVDPSARAAQREPWQPAAADPGEAALTGAGAFGGGGTTRLGWADPGRRGVRALAAVAAVVVLIAAFLAWRARPRADPVAAPPPATTLADEPPAPGSAAGAPTGGAPAGSAGPAAEVVVSVGGKVGRPGLIRLPAGARVADAIAAAGGARPGTDVALLNLARKVVDGEQILVGVSAPPGAPPAGPPGAPAPGGPVNLNTATLADLDALPGVGPVLAQRILDARTAQGGFRAVTDLRQVEGIGSARYEQIKDLVTV